jgi:hypothetical protein
VTKTKGDCTPHKTSTSKPPTNSTPQAPAAQKGTYVASASNQSPADRKADNKLKGSAGEEEKEILADLSNLDKKLWISLNLDPKLVLTLITFL